MNVTQPEAVPVPLLIADKPKDIHFNLILMLITIAVLLVSISAMGLMLYRVSLLEKKMLAVKPEVNVVSVAPEPVGLPTPSPVSEISWKDYSNVKLGISLRYPQEIFTIALAQASGSADLLVSNAAKDLNLSVTVLESQASVSQYLSSIFLTSSDFSKLPITISGINGYRVSYTLPKDGVKLLQNNFVTEALVMKNRNIYLVRLTAYDLELLKSNQSIFGQILNSININ